MIKLIAFFFLIRKNNDVAAIGCSIPESRQRLKIYSYSMNDSPWIFMWIALCTDPEWHLLWYFYVQHRTGLQAAWLLICALSIPPFGAWMISSIQTSYRNRTPHFTRTKRFFSVRPPLFAATVSTCQWGIVPHAVCVAPWSAKQLFAGANEINQVRA